MLLSLLAVDTAKYQFREAPFSEQTVAGIVAAGIDVAQFGALPVVKSGKSWVIAGDGHSRFEAVRRLAESGKLPKLWKSGGDWDIPTLAVEATEAKRLAWTGNLTRDNLTPLEEARVFQSMLDSGLPMAEVATAAHRSTAHVEGRLPLNSLCLTIRRLVGLPSDGGGVPVEVACVLAERFARHNMDHQCQQNLFNELLKDVFLTTQTARQFVDKFGPEVARKSSQGLLFALPASTAAVLKTMKDQMAVMRKTANAIKQLQRADKAGILASCPALTAALAAEGEQALAALTEITTTHAAQLVFDCVASAA